MGRPERNAVAGLTVGLRPIMGTVLMCSLGPIESSSRVQCCTQTMSSFTDYVAACTRI